MRLGVRRLAVLLAVAATACADGVGPTGSDGVGIQLSLQAPSAVSAAETAALQTSFDRVDTYRITVRDSVTGSVLAADTVAVAAGLAEHRFDFELPPSLVGTTVQVSVVGLDGSQELYRAEAYTRVQQAVAGAATPVVLPVRYTGPGVRGTVTNEAGVGQGGVSVGLYQASNLVTGVSTEPDGTYLFLNIQPGVYSIEPTPPGNLFSCPVGRTVDVQADQALVADFLASSVPCEINLLVLSGGDIDNTQTVADLFANTPGVTTETFFYVNQTPGLNALRQYDVVLLFTNGIFDETTALGSELAQYIQAGGNLVIGSFYWQGRSDSGFGSPGWGTLESFDPFTSDVDPFTGKGGATYTANALNGNNIVAHPLTLGVTSLTSLAGYSAGVLAKPNATVVAYWQDGAPLVGYRVLGGGQRIVAVSLFPAAAIPTEVSGSVQVLWENAVTWAGVAGGPIP